MADRQWPPTTKWNSTIGYIQGFDQSVTLYDPISGINQSVHGLIAGEHACKGRLSGCRAGSRHGQGDRGGGWGVRHHNLRRTHHFRHSHSPQNRGRASSLTECTQGRQRSLECLTRTCRAQIEGGTRMYLYWGDPWLPGGQGGLTSGDVITDVDGQRIVGSTAALSDILLPKAPGEKVRIAWVNPSGNSHSAIVTLASGPPD